MLALLVYKTRIFDGLNKYDYFYAKRFIKMLYIIYYLLYIN